MILSVIIVNYNVKYFLEQCLCSAVKAIEVIDAEIFVVDNASTDGSVEYLKDKFPQVKFISSPKNIGFAKANNLALKSAGGKYILYLNPDTIVAENSFTQCINFLETHTAAGAAGLQLLDGSGCFLPESKRAFPAVRVAFWKICGMASLFPQSKIFNRYALGHLDKNGVHQVDVLVGAFMMVRKNILNKLNGFDEDYFMYGEDIDLSKRITDMGYKNFYLGDNAIIHFKGESTSKESIKYVTNFYNAMNIFVGKHYKGANSFIIKFLLKLTIQLRAAMASIAVPFTGVINNFKKISPKKDKEIIIIADENDKGIAEEILSVLNHLYINKSMNEVKQSLPDEDEIIFCTGTVSYRDTIHFVHHHPKKYFYKWHGKNSLSIAGSSLKNKTGEVYTLNFPPVQRDNNLII